MNKYHRFLSSVQKCCTQQFFKSFKSKGESSDYLGELVYNYKAYSWGVGGIGRWGEMGRDRIQPGDLNTESIFTSLSCSLSTVTHIRIIVGWGFFSCISLTRFSNILVKETNYILTVAIYLWQALMTVFTPKCTRHSIFFSQLSGCQD